MSGGVRVVSVVTFVVDVVVDGDVAVLVVRFVGHVPLLVTTRVACV